MRTSWLLQILAVVSASVLVAGTAESIGAINVAGNFRINGRAAAAHATLLSGATIETGAASGEIELAGGVHVVIGAGAAGQLYRDRLLLRRGSAQVEHAAGYVVDARGFRVFLSANKGSARVTVTPAGIQVEALSGRAQVANSAGKPLAWVPPGKVLTFDGPADLTQPVQSLKVTGTLFQDNGHTYLIDKTTNLKVELNGDGLSPFVGHGVQAVGNVVATNVGQNVAYVNSVSSVHAIARTPVAPP